VPVNVRELPQKSVIPSVDDSSVGTEYSVEVADETNWNGVTSEAANGGS